MKNKVYIVEMDESGKLYAFGSEKKAKEFMLKSYLKNDITNAKYYVADSTNVDNVVDIIKTDIECILEQGYLEGVMCMSVAEFDKEMKDDE